MSLGQEIASLGNEVQSNIGRWLDQGLSRYPDDQTKVRAATILAGDDMPSAGQFAALLGTSRMTVNTKRQATKYWVSMALSAAFAFPAWPVSEDGKPFAALPGLFEWLGGGPWLVYRFLIQAHPELDGTTGREALRRGKADEALAVADSIARRLRLSVRA